MNALQDDAVQNLILHHLHTLHPLVLQGNAARSWRCGEMLSKASGQAPECSRRPDELRNGKFLTNCHQHSPRPLGGELAHLRGEVLHCQQRRARADARHRRLRRREQDGLGA